MSEKEIDISVFTKLLDPNNKFIETVEFVDEEEIRQQMLDAINKNTGATTIKFVDEAEVKHAYTKKNGRWLTMAERDKKRPRGFSV